MKSQRLRLWLAFVLFLSSLGILAAASVPLARMQQVTPLPALGLARIIPTGRMVGAVALTGAPLNVQDPAAAQRKLSLDWPSTIRLADRDRITLAILGPDTPTAATPEVSNTHNLVAIARLDLPGLEAQRGEIREALRPERPVHFRWELQTLQPGVYQGTVWLHLDRVPKDGSPAEQQLLLARPIEIAVIRVLGMPAGIARGVGSLGLFGSAALALPWLRARLPRSVQPSPGPARASNKEVHPPGR